MFEPAGRERLVGPSCIIVGVLAGLPYLLLGYLPLTDLPLHQLSFATWVEPARFGGFYERQSYWLPYWTAPLLARPFVGLLGVEMASRIPVFLYVAALPSTSALLARAAGRSGTWGLLLAAFALEANLEWGFVAYCLGGILIQVVLALALFAERTRRPWPMLAAQALAAAVLGFTHPQSAAAGVACCALVALLGPRGRRLAIAAASVPALVPGLVYFATNPGALGGAVSFAGPVELIRRLPQFSIDVFDGPVEEGLFACAVLLLALSWRGARRPTCPALRLALLVLILLAAYLVTPFNWNGQAVCQRVPFVALLLLPGLAAPGRLPTLGARALVALVALAGAGNAALVLRAFDRETAADLDPLIAAAPSGARTIYLSYDTSWPGIHSLAYLHTGAYVTLRKGGVYAFHFNGLNTRYTDAVPRAQTMIGREGVLSRRHATLGELVLLPYEGLSFWDTVLIRYPAGVEPFVPIRGAPSTELEVGRRFALLRLR
jgi:hypothetical protein